MTLAAIKRCKTLVLDKIRCLFANRFAEKILLIFSVGSGFDSLIAKIVPGHHLYPDPSFRQVDRNGVFFNLNISHLVDWATYFGFYEKSLNTLFETAQAGDIVFDIGVNIGGTALLLAKRVGSEGGVYGFEPDPNTFEVCRQNLSLNEEIKNVFLEPVALTDKNCTLTFRRVSARNPGMNRIVSGENTIGTISVAGTTLDQFVVSKKIPKIDLIKIDVEGHERKVIEGSLDSIKKFKPKIFLELSDKNLHEAGTTASELVAQLEDLGYSVRTADAGTIVRPFAELKDCHFDVLCSPIGRV